MSRRLHFLGLVVRRGAPPAVAAGGLVTLLIGGSLLAFADVGREHPVLVSGVLAGVVFLGAAEGAYRLWDAADVRARSYEGDTELQRGIAFYLREGREVRGRLQGASEQQLRNVAFELWAWVGIDVHQWLDVKVGADELEQEWKEVMPGLQASDLDAFEAAIGPFTRGNLLAYVDRGLARLVLWQNRLRGD